MITAIIAQGTKGEMGFQGKLPWKDYKLELETFYDTLAKIAPTIIIIGASTYKSLPKAVIDRIRRVPNLRTKEGEEIVADLHVVGLSAVQEVSLEKGIIDFTPILNVGKNFKDFYPDEFRAVCIGGASLLDKLMRVEAIKDVYISTVFPLHPKTTIEADVFVPKSLSEVDATKVLIGQVIDENELFGHSQEYWYL